MEAITFKLEDFEGPMDLLLYLVSKNKMSLYDISILELIDQVADLDRPGNGIAFTVPVDLTKGIGRL